jgi:hypothetical protein
MKSGEGEKSKAQKRSRTRRGGDLGRKQESKEVKNKYRRKHWRAIRYSDGEGRRERVI